MVDGLVLKSSADHEICCILSAKDADMPTLRGLKSSADHEICCILKAWTLSGPRRAS